MLLLVYFFNVDRILQSYQVLRSPPQASFNMFLPGWFGFIMIQYEILSEYKELTIKRNQK